MAATRTRDDEIENTLTKAEKLETLKVQVFQNPLILETIIECTDFRELKISRRVNKIWLSIANKDLKRHRCPLVKMNLNMDQDSKIESLHQVLINSVDFPFTNCVIYVSNQGLKDESVDRLFSAFGQRIKSLSLAASPQSRGDLFDDYFVAWQHGITGEPRHDVLLQILRNWVPNLENLTIRNCTRFSSGDIHVWLPALKHFEWENCRESLVSGIIKGAPSVQTIKGFKVDQHVVLQTLIDVGKIDKILYFSY